jgi:uncharacterized protein YjbI with pentapeptide repeats
MIARDLDWMLQQRIRHLMALSAHSCPCRYRKPLGICLVKVYGWFMRTKKSILNCALALITLWMTSLACRDYLSDSSNPTMIAPQDLSNMDLSGLRMIGDDLSNKNLSGVNFSHSDLSFVNFANSNCQGAIFDYASLGGANFSSAILDRKWALIIDVLTNEGGTRKDLAGYDFSKTDMSQYDFPESNLQDANFQNTELQGANFGGANLARANFSGAILIGGHAADFSRANLTGANFSGVEFKVFQQEELHINFSYANLTNAVISPTQLKYATLACTKLPDGKIALENLCPNPTLTP